jgi:subtilase family serine protease
MAYDPVISADGAFVAFTSRSTDLVAGVDGNGSDDIFLYERATGTVTLVSHVPGGPGTAGNSFSQYPGISADGAYVAFTSYASNLVAATDANGAARSDAFLYERATGTVTLVSHAVGAPGTTGNGASAAAGLSADGAFVLVSSRATNLVAGTDENGSDDVFLYERATSINTLMSRRGLADGPDLVATSVSNPPATMLPGGRFTVSDGVLNQGNEGAADSTARYYLSLVPGKTGGSTLLTGSRTVGSLEAGASSDGSKTVTVPISTALGTYYLLACADDRARVTEIDEANNCAVAATQVTVGRPDLVVTAVSDPPGAAARGSSFSVTETVANQSALDAGASTTRYYFSLNHQREAGDRLLMGTRAVPALDAGESSPATPVTVTIPANMAAGTYFLLACADDMRQVMEGSETNHCRASATTVVVP